MTSTPARVLAGWRFRLAAAREPRTLLAPLVTLAAVTVGLLAGPGAPAQVSIVTSQAIAFPLLAWAARQVLDAPPQDQQSLDALALGSRRRAHVAAVLAAFTVTCAAGGAALAWALLRVDEAGVRVSELAGGVALATATAACATALGTLASRRVAGGGTGPVLVLVAVPLLTAVLGASREPAVNAVVPRLGPALRAAYAGTLLPALPALLGQLLLWSLVVVAATTPRAR